MHVWALKHGSYKSEDASYELSALILILDFKTGIVPYKNDW